MFILSNQIFAVQRQVSFPPPQITNYLPLNVGIQGDGGLCMSAYSQTFLHLQLSNLKFNKIHHCSKIVGRSYVKMWNYGDLPGHHPAEAPEEVRAVEQVGPGLVDDVGLAVVVPGGHAEQALDVGKPDSEYTGWPIRFVKTYRWHWFESCVLV